MQAEKAPEGVMEGLKAAVEAAAAGLLKGRQQNFFGNND